MRAHFFLLPALLLAACSRQPDVERIALDDVREDTGAIVLTPSPDSEDAKWTLAADGLSIRFGKDPRAPYLSLACRLSKDAAPAITITRYAQTEPGAKALFAVLGANATARLKLDARLSGKQWLWQGTYPADAAELKAFTGPRGFEATLPGAGMLKAGGSPIPAEFIDWCQAGGKALIQAAKASSTPG